MGLSIGLPTYPEYTAFSSMSQRKALTLILLGQAVFELESIAAASGVTEIELELPISLNDPDLLVQLSHELRTLFNLVLLKDFELSIASGNAELEPNSEVSPAKVVYLFSGGVDSVCAVLASSLRGMARALFCSHTDQSKIRAIVQNLNTILLRPEGIELLTLRVPKIGKGRFRQTRGFLYLLTGSAVAAASGANALVVSEVGPTMYQPRFGPLDQVTMTTHPYVVEIAEAVARLVLGAAPAIVRPFSDCTKAEIMAACSRPEVFAETHSCITQRFGSHDGTCYGCVMRRLSAVVAGVPDVEYERDPVLDSGARADNLVYLLDYCLSYLTDYQGMPAFRREAVELFGKYDLFWRYSLDVFAALHIIVSDGNMLSEVVERYYRDALRDVGEARLEARIRTVRSQQPER